MRQVGTARDFLDSREGTAQPRRGNRFGPVAAETGDLAETEAERVGAEVALTLPIASAMGPFPLPVGEGARIPLPPGEGGSAAGAEG